MTSKLTRERIEWLNYAATGLVANGTEMAMSPQDVIALTESCLAAMDSEPVAPIWGATKYPVSRPMPGTKLIVWDDTGKFVGYGSAVDTSESGVAIQMCDGRRLDSNHELRWQYALQPVPVVDNEPVAYMWDSKRNNIDAPGFYFPEHLFFAESNVKQWGGEVIPLYRHAQQPVVPETAHSSVIAEQLAHVLSDMDVTDHQRAVISCAVDRLNNVAQLLQLSPSALFVPEILDYQGAKELYNYLMTEEETNATVNGCNACRAAMLQAGNSPVIPDGYVMVPKDLLSELRDWAHPEIEKYCEMWEGRRDSEFPALRKVIADADADALLAAAQKEVKS